MTTSLFKYPLLLLAITSLFITSSCDDDDDMTTTPTSNTIVDIASGNPDLSILVEALTITDLVSTLSMTGTYTVFAPNNKAFTDLLDSNPAWSSLSDIPEPLLKNVLLFHVIGSKVMAADLTDTYVNTLAMGPNDEDLSLQVSVSGGVMFNGMASPLTADVSASNGVVHIIDKVMLPPSIVDLAINNQNFSTLVAALTDPRHTTDFVAVLSGDGPFTVFAPNNNAFQMLLDSDSTWNSIGDIPITTLDAVLKYHVVNAANVQSDQLTDMQQITMLGGDMITIDLSAGAAIMTSSSQTVNISGTDIQGANGVIHSVDKVLLP